VQGSRIFLMPPRPFRQWVKYPQAFKVAQLAYAIGPQNMPKRKRAGSKPKPYARARKTYRKKGAGNSSRKTLTRQHDIRSRKSGKMSVTKRRWVKFVKKVEKATLWSDNPISLVENNANVMISTKITGRKFQNYFSTGDTPVNDIRVGAYYSASAGLGRFIPNIRNLANDETATATARYIASNPGIQDIIIKSSSITMAIKNVSGDANGGYDGSEPENIYVDIYECVSRIDIHEVDYRTAHKCWTECLADSINAVGATGLPAPAWGILQPQIAGVSPYNAPKFGKYWKVINKTRVLIPAGSTVNTTISGYKGKINWAEFSENREGSDMNPKGKVKDFIIIVDPTYNLQTSPARPAEKELAELQWTKTWHIGMQGPNPMQSIAATYSY